MAVVDIARTGVNRVLSKFGASFQYWTAINTYNAYGDKTSSWAAPTSFTAAMAPASKEQIRELKEFGRPITSKVTLVCLPSININTNDRVSVFSDYYEVSDVNEVAVGGTKIYKQVVTNKITQT